MALKIEEQHKFHMGQMVKGTDSKTHQVSVGEIEIVREVHVIDSFAYLIRNPRTQVTTVFLECELELV